MTFERFGGMLTQVGFWTIISIVGLLIVGAVVAGLLAWNYYRKKWYLIVEFKMAREDGRAVSAEIGKGYHDAKRGMVWVKRQGMKQDFIKCNDIGKYLQGNNIVTVAGGPDNWRLVIPDSFLEYVDEESGEDVKLVKFSGNFGDERMWKTYAERSNTETYSISSLLHEYKDYLGWGLVIFVVIIAQVISHFLG